MEIITLKINGKKVTAPAGSTILEATRMTGITIPTLCWLKDINEIGACRMCEVEVKGEERLITSCITKVKGNMEVWTHSPKVLQARKKTLQLLLSNHERKCLSCIRNEKCELQALCKEYGVEDDGYFDGECIEFDIDTTAVHMERNNNKCILCRRCVAVCKKVQGIGVIGNNSRGFESYIGSAFDMGIGNTSCVACGQCINVCPTGALYEKDLTSQAFEAIADPDKVVIVQTAPSVRASLGECFGLPVGSDTEGKMVAALRRLGFDKVFDTNFAADLTIVEEANELIQRFQNGGKLPMITSCSPGWIKYCEHYYPDMIEHLSTCKSPQQMFGAITKTYYAEKMSIPPENIVVVSVMPCTAKKFESSRDKEAGVKIVDVDIALTTRELSRMIEKVGIRFMELPNEKFDEPLGLSTGASVLFGVTGGVMEASLRTAVEKLTGEELDPLEFTQIRGNEGMKEASYDINGLEVRVAVVSGLSNVKILLEAIKNGSANYHFVEIMACPGGCINGGGQPHQPASIMNFMDIRKKRAEVLYNIDRNKTIRKSHENLAIIELYKTYLKEPGSHRAHEILHTNYIKREVHNI